MSFALHAQVADAGKAPRTPEGKPDLQGIWETRNAAAFDVSEIAEGHEIPYLPAALDREQKGPRVDPIIHCMMPGVPRITYMPFPFQIFQTADFVAITYEDADSARQFATSRGFGWPILHDGQALIDTLGVSTYPTLMLLDPSGHVAGVAIGMSMRDDEAKRVADLKHWIELWQTAARAPL